MLVCLTSCFQELKYISCISHVCVTAFLNVRKWLLIVMLLEDTMFIKIFGMCFRGVSVYEQETQIMAMAFIRGLHLLP